MKNQKRQCIISGSFDPITDGHLWVINEGLKIFDAVNVVIATNPMKKPMFTPKERRDIILSVVNTARLNVYMLPENELVVSLAKEWKIKHLLRGIRNAADFDYETQLLEINRDIAPEVETVFVCPPPEFAKVSSSMVKSLIGLKGWTDIASKYVHQNVVTAMVEKLKDKKI